MLADVDLNTDINQSIIHKEILKGINMLKNNNACHNDKSFNKLRKVVQIIC